MNSFYQITLLVTSEHEDAIIDLYRQRQWVYTKLKTGYSLLEDVTTPTPDCSDRPYTSIKDNDSFRMSHIPAVTTSYESLPGNKNCGEENVFDGGELSFKVVKTEPSFFMENADLTLSEPNQNDMEDMNIFGSIEQLDPNPCIKAEPGSSDLAVFENQESVIEYGLDQIVPDASQKKKAAKNRRGFYSKKVRRRKTGIALNKNTDNENLLKIQHNERASGFDSDSLNSAINDNVSIVKKRSRQRQGDGGFFCEICATKFVRKSTYEMHLLYDRCTRTCGYCGRVFAFKNRTSFEMHLKRHKKQYDYECVECGLKFVEKDKFKKHQQTSHNKDYLFKCEQCSLRLPTELDLKLHRLTKHNVEKGKFSCSECPSVFAQAKGLRNHMNYTHLLKSDPFLPCRFCGNLYNARTISAHEKTHKASKDYKCEHCPSAFKRKQDLTCHMKRHTKTYSRYCETCGKGFYTATLLKLHLRVHTGEKPYSCPQCEYRCTLKTNLTKHMKVHCKSK